MNAPNPSKACAAGRHHTCTRRSCSCECHVVTTPMAETLVKELTELFEPTTAEKVVPRVEILGIDRKAANRRNRIEVIEHMAKRIADLARELNT